MFTQVSFTGVDMRQYAAVILSSCFALCHECIVINYHQYPCQPVLLAAPDLASPLPCSRSQGKTGLSGVGPRGT